MDLIFRMRKIAIIANPKAGQGKALERARRLHASLLRKGLTSECHVPESAEEARAVVRGAVSGGTDVVVVAGGDGTVRDVLDLLAGTSTALGILCSGRGNDFVRGLQSPRSVRSLVQSIADRHTTTVDLGSGNGALFATVATCGLDAEVGQQTTAGSKLAGSAGYVLQALKSIRTFSGYAVRVEVNGEPIFEDEATLVACANTPTYGGGLQVAPGAHLSDGMLELCVIRRVSRLGALALLPLLAVGEHVGHPVVELRRVSEIRITTDGSVPMLIDGEPLSTNTLDVQIRPAALKVVA